MLNGMPPAGRAFSDDFASHLKAFDPHQSSSAREGPVGFQSVQQDDYVFVWFGCGEWANCYIKLAGNVDDMLICYKGGERVMEAFDAHIEVRWKQTKHELDGYLNNQFYPSDDGYLITITMDVRISQIMHEHLPDEVTNSVFPDTPYHPMLMQLAMGDASFDKAIAKHALRRMSNVASASSSRRTRTVTSTWSTSSRTTIAPTSSPRSSTPNPSASCAT